jgi:glycosyltransferase involved in cell wall biosynthesis
VDRVNLAYLEHYRQRARAVVRWAGQGFTLSGADSGRLFDRLLCPRQRFGPDLWPLLARGAALGWGGRQAHGKFLFNTGHSGLEQPGYPALLKRQGARPVFFVHDLIPITHPEYCRPGEDGRHARRMDAVLGLAAGVVANSQATLAELARYAESRGKAMPPAAVALLAPGLSAAAPPGPRPLAPPYFVMLGTIEPRKNHAFLLQLWRRLAERLGDAAPRLVVVGQRGWECENAADLLERCPALRGLVAEVPRCADAELADWLRHAQALLFPSFAEGYGLPLAEALALGVPAIASDLPAFREIAGGVPDYLDPLDGNGWAAAIAAYARPASPARAAQLRRLAGLRLPTWEEHFAVVDGFLERLDAQR